MNKKGFIFDLDGVIVDTAKYHFLAWKKLANDLGIDFTEDQNEQLKGVSRVKSLEKILNWGGVSISEEEFLQLMDKKNTDYLSYIETMTEDEILVDVPKVLNLLKVENQGLALGSASKNARTILKKVELFDKFDSIVDGTNVTKAKPDPEVFIIAAENLEIAPEKCIVFEDSIAGIQAANAANMISIGIGQKDVLSEADYVFKDFSEISEEFITQLINKH
ncbi:beta-phosphoglucomutase [Tenacibaculum jejuense]|uniref:Putative glucose-1-phosphate phosphodismutase, beta-phosphoglucomutase n=1 Tax=Tenacibaculum jejuense TaxID=584609 RepID=A0A238UB73_9FLAO|nr:beta-phosphoglucomutase [Tenacibaculum jejuense]SNR15828.1 putative glucose-1-phosphate phosphodismutase, beta-phosphoglucomutase [Tenacibaculum jejuense]